MGLRDGQRASIDVSFIFGDDWRVSDLTDAELLAYFRLWGRAVQYRVHLLPPKFNVHNHSKLAQEVKSHRDTAANMLRKCRENALISVLDDGRILVVGVGVKHSWMVFKDGPNGEGWQSKNGKPYSDKDEGCRKKDVPVGGNSRKLPDSPALLPEPEKPKNAEKAKTQADRSDFLGHWRSEFLNDRGRKYIAIPGDPKAASQIISAVGLAEAMRLASIFIRAPVDDWQRANTTIRVMQTRLNAIGGENGNGDNAIDRARKQLAESIAARRCEDGRPESNRLVGGELAGTGQGQ